jgi:hypothetical protein
MHRRSFVTSGNCSGSGTSQSMQRNLRPPILTSMNRIGLLHLEQVEGGGFLGMVVSNSGAVVASSRSIWSARRLHLSAMIIA